MRVAVIPAFNEAATIGSVVLRTQPYADKVIVVDDGSTDGTAQIAEQAGGEVLPHDRNEGKGAAIRTGIRAGLECDADIFVLLDGDGQHDPESIPELVEPIEDGNAELVVGSRSIPGNGTPSLPRKFGRNVLDTLTNLVNGTSISDTQSGFRAINSELAQQLEWDTPGMSVESVMLSEATNSDARIAEIEISENYPKSASPNQNPISHSMAVVNSLLKIVRRDHPLLVFGVVGVVSLLIGGYIGYDMATHYWSTGAFWPGRAMLSMLFTIVGTQLVTAALILDTVKLRVENG